MAKTCRTWDVDQAWLLPPPWIHDFVAPGHPLHPLWESMCEELELR